MNTEEKKLIPIEELSGLNELLEKNKLEKQDLLPAKFHAKTKRSFILEVPGVDSFLVQNITEMPRFKSSWFNKKYTFNCDGNLRVTYYSPAAPSTIQQMAELLETNKRFNIVLKQLDPIGTTIAQQTFHESKLESFSISNLSYDTSDLEKIYATFECKKATIDF